MDNLERNWVWLLGLGILFVLLGIIGLSMVVGLTIASMYFFAALLIIAGISHFVDVFKHRDWQGTIWQAIIAALYLIGASVILYDPLLASIVITALIAATLIMVGTTRIIMAISLRASKEWSWLLFAGIASIILGILIIMQWPVSGLWVIGLFIAIEMMIAGWTYIFIAFSLRASIGKK